MASGAAAAGRSLGDWRCIANPARRQPDDRGKKGAYVFTAKDNQSTLVDQSYQAVADPAPRTASETSRHGDRHEKRSIKVTDAKDVNRPSAQQTTLLNRDANRAGEVSCETVPIITSLRSEQADAQTLQRVVRAHWGIENCLHYVCDATMGEDDSHVRRGRLRR